MKLIAVKFAPAVVPAVAALKPTADAIRAMRPAFAVLRAAQRMAGRFADRLPTADKPEPTIFDPYLLDPDFLAALLDDEAKRYDLPPGAWDDLDICRWLAIGQALERHASKAHASARPILDRSRGEVLRKRGAPRGPRKK